MGAKNEGISRWATRGMSGALVVMLVLAGLIGFGSPASAAIVEVGGASYTTQLPPGAQLPSGCAGISTNPRQFVTQDAPAGALPTNEWWSSLIFKRTECRHSETLVAGPLSFRTGADGLGVSYPTEVTTVGSASGTAEYHYPYQRDFRIGVEGLDASQTLVANWSDWTVTPQWSSAGRQLRATIGHGLPFVYATAQRGAAQVVVDGSPEVWLNDGARVGFRIKGHDYVAFAPVGNSWTVSGSTISAPTSGSGDFSIAVLPTVADTTTTRRLDLAERFSKYAYSFVTDTHVTWNYDRSASAVRADYEVTTQARKGNQTGTVVATVPHHRDVLVEMPDPIADRYVSPRGRMDVFVGVDGFATRDRFTGVIPELPSVGLGPVSGPNEGQAATGAQEAELRQLITAAASEDPMRIAGDTYWTGKALGRAARLAQIADQLGMVQQRDVFLASMKNRMKDWFTATPGKASRVFYYDNNWGTLIGYPAGYGSDTELNDHHFHWSYWVSAAATLARFDADFAAGGAYASMINELIADTANSDRTSIKYPFLRDFDPYAGHSWASGSGSFFAGNNQESSSESMNFAQAVVQWGEVTGNADATALGAYLYTTEAAAVEKYWHDIDGDVFPEAFAHDSVGMVWGDGGAYATWFSAAPEMIHGINMLPMTAGSLYLGHHPDYVRSQLAELRRTKGSAPAIWLDILWQYQALADPEQAWVNYRANPSYQEEEGESRAHVFHSLAAMRALGNVDPDVTADHPNYAVFTKGGQRTYVAANLTTVPITVRFSSGHEMVVPGGRTVAAGLVDWTSQSGSPIPDPTPTPAPTDPSPTPSVPTPTPPGVEPTPTPTPTPSAPTPTPTPTPTLTVPVPSPSVPVGGGVRSAFVPWEAEAAQEVSGSQVRGPVVGALGNGDFLRFDGVDFGAGVFQAYARVAGGSDGSGLVRFRVGSPTGPVVGDFALASTGGWDQYVTVPANAGGVSGVQTLFVTFESGYSGDYVNLDRLVFGAIGQPTPDLSHGVGNQGPTPSPTDSAPAPSVPSAPTPPVVEPTPMPTVPTPTPTPTPSAPAPTPTLTVPVPSPSVPVGGGVRSAFVPWEAEVAQEVSGSQVRGPVVGALGNGDFLRFDGVDFGAGVFQAYARVAGGSDGSGLVRFRVGSPTGPVVGDFALASTGGWDQYVTVPANAGGVSGVQTLFVTFESGYSGDYVNLDRLVFGAIGQPAPDLSQSVAANGAADPGEQALAGSSHASAPDPQRVHGQVGLGASVPSKSSKKQLKRQRSRCLLRANRTAAAIGDKGLARQSRAHLRRECRVAFPLR